MKLRFVLIAGLGISAVVAAEMATATAVNATHRVVRAGIVLSLWQFIFPECRKPGAGWQGQAYSARRNSIVARRQLCDDCADELGT